MNRRIGCAMLPDWNAEQFADKLLRRWKSRRTCMTGQAAANTSMRRNGCASTELRGKSTTSVVAPFVSPFSTQVAAFLRP